MDDFASIGASSKVCLKRTKCSGMSVKNGMDVSEGKNHGKNNVYKCFEGPSVVIWFAGAPVSVCTSQKGSVSMLLFVHCAMLVG